MGISPRVVTEDRSITWDGVQQRLPKGQVMDVAPDSPLERAIGRQYLVPLGATSALPPAEQPAETAAAHGGGAGGAESALEVSQPAPVKLPAVGAKKQDTETAPAKVADDKGSDK